MSRFDYKGRNASGQLVSGILEASSAEAAAGRIASLGLTPVSLQEVRERVSVLEQLREKLGQEKVRMPELIIFCRQMYTITKAGIPLISAVRGLASSVKHNTLRKVLEEVADDLESGMGLASALSSHPEVFNGLFISIVHVGENSGRLDEAFLQLSEYLERDMETRKSIKAALRYPTFVVIAIALAIAIINIKVIPEFAKMFAQFGADLPLPTKILIGTSNVFVDYWPYLFAAIALAVLVWREYLKTEQGQRIWGEKKLRLPLVGSIIERGSMARYSRSFAMMMRSGVPLTTALELCSRVVDNFYLAEKIRGIRSGIERGDSLLRSHTASGMFTQLVLQMVAVGEESGKVDELLGEVAGYYEREVDYDIKSLGAKIEPILIVVMAAFVLVLALGIFLPMWGMYEIQR
ncbi:type II secretion system F family protein [Proteobacteria bacterium 005FR1]|nr:type II secretion system F family protein [Proteobacteria bacterium 005FR1]